MKANDSPPAPGPGELPPPPRRRGCGCWTIVLICIGVPLLAIPIAYGLSRYVSAAELDRTIAALREKGEPTTVEELNALYPSTPESERATALWFTAVESVDWGDREDERLMDFVRWIDDPRDRYVKQFMPIWPTEAGGKVGPEAANVVDQFLAGKESALQNVRQAVAAGGTTRFVLEDERESSARERWRRYSGLLNLLRLECERRRIDGDGAGVAESIRTTLAFGEMLREEPDPVLQDYRRYCASVAGEQLEKALIRDELSDEDLADLQKRFEEIDYEPSLRGVALVNQLRHVRLSQGKEDLDPHFAQFRYFPESNSVLALEYHAMLVRGSGNYDTARMADAEVDAAIHEAAVTMSKSPVGVLYAVRQGEAMAGILHSRFEWKGLRSRETWNDLTATAIAVARWRREKGELPPNLEALVPEYLDSVPVDVEVDAPILYRASEKGYVVYARGFDGEDNGAMPSEFGTDYDWPVRVESDRFGPPPEPAPIGFEEFGMEGVSSAPPGETSSDEAPESDAETPPENSAETPSDSSNVEVEP